MNFRVFIFFMYSILYESLIWGIFAYAVFWQGCSSWWFLLAVWLSASQLTLKHFGIPQEPDTPNTQEK